MKLALAFMGGEGWFGGLAHLRNLIRALKLAEPESETVVLAQPLLGSTARARLADLLGAEVVGAESSMDFIRILRGEGVDALFAPDREFLGHRLPVPWLAFFHDFQHERLPEFFSPDEAQARRDSFQRAATLSDLLMLSGESVLADAREFLPGSAHKARIVPPQAWPAPDLPGEAPDEARRRLGLPERYLLMPSQFWSHKNHLAVLEALERCWRQGVTLAFTGSLDDDRDPRFRLLLEERLKPLVRCGAALVLGRIAYPDVLQLMRRARAVILPSLFEGFGIPVSEAAALGKTLVLSDIAPHREHGADHTNYFSPTDTVALAGLMLDAWDATGPCHDPARESAGLELARRKAQATGQALAEAVREAVRARSVGSRELPSPALMVERGLFRDAAVELAREQARGIPDIENGVLLDEVLFKAGLPRVVKAAYALGGQRVGDALALRLLEQGASGDLEQLYQAALEALCWGGEAAIPLLEQVAEAGEAPRELRAWAFFKLGQHASGTDPGRAATLFRKALVQNSGHAKARLALVPRGCPVRMDLGPDPAPGFIGVLFDPLDDGLWDYYLEGRLALELRLPAPGAAGESWPDDLARLLRERLCPGGSARIDSLDDSGRRLLARALARQGFTVFRKGPGLLARSPAAR